MMLHSQSILFFWKERDLNGKRGRPRKIESETPKTYGTVEEIRDLLKRIANILEELNSKSGNNKWLE
jgi:hypothetical protein